MDAGDTTATRASARLDNSSALRASEAARAAQTDSPPKPRRRVVSSLAGINPVVVAIFAAGFAFAAYYSSQVTHWIVMSDELQYAKLALDIGETLSPIPEIRGEYTGSLSQLYPLLTAPFWTLWSTPTAFELVHWANAAIMASTSIPAYLLTRDVTASRHAGYLVALLSVTVPWIAMGTMVLTEAAAYPAFAWAVLGMQRSITAPGAGADALAVAGLGLAFLARTQFAVLAMAYPAAIVAHEAGWSAIQAGRRRLRAAWAGVRNAFCAHRELAVLYGLAALIALGLAATDLLGDLVGRYETTLHEGSLVPAGLADAVVRHLDFLALGLGILPLLLAGAWALGSLVRPSTRRGHAFAVLAVLTVVATAAEVGSFTLRFTSGAQVHDRYLFYVAPLLFVGMAACLLDPRRRWKSVLATGAALMWLMSMAFFESYDLPFFASPDTLFHSELAAGAHDLGGAIGIDDLALTDAAVVAVGALTVATAALLRALRPATSLAMVGLAVLAFCVIETRYVLDRITSEIVPASAATNPPPPPEGRDWVDQALPDGASAAVLPSPVNSNRSGVAQPADDGLTRARWLDTEFWNKSVDRAYAFGGYGGFAPFHTGEVELDWASGRLAVPDPQRFWIVSATDVRLRPDARLVEASGAGLDLIAPREPNRAAWATRGVDVDGWSREAGPVVLRLYPDGRSARRTVALRLQSSPEIAGPVAFRVRSAGLSRAGRVDPGAALQETFTACVPGDRPRDLAVAIAGRPRLADAREPGLRITGITVSGAGRPCRPAAG